MFKTIANAFKSREIRTKLLITVGLLFLYRLGCWIPIPGLNAENMRTAMVGDDFFSLLNGITGNALQNGTLLALGISPYINASIITQLLGIAIPAIERWSQEGDDGKRKMSNFTRIVTLIIAIAQSVGIVVSFGSKAESALALDALIWSNIPAFVVGMLVVFTLVGGSIFTMWLGEKITDLGIGNGISLIIFMGILSTAGQAIISTFQLWFGNTAQSAYAPWYLVTFLFLVIIIFGFITFIDMSERRIPVQYAKQIKGRKQYGGQSTYIPIKVNASGVLPIIFATAIVSFPQLIMSMFLDPGTSEFYKGWQEWVGTGQPIYFVINGLLILFFSYFYAQIQFKPDEVSRNLQQYGGFIPGIRPGKPTAEYLSRTNKRLTLFGAIYLAVIFIVPAVIMKELEKANIIQSVLVGAFSSTGMLIVVSVALEFEKQLESQLMMKQYKGFLK